MHRERRVGFYISLHSELWVGMMFGVQSRPLARPWELMRSMSKSCCCLQSGLLLWVSAVGHTIVLWSVERRQLCCRQLQVSSVPPFSLRPYTYHVRKPSLNYPKGAICLLLEHGDTAPTLNMSPIPRPTEEELES